MCEAIKPFPHTDASRCLCSRQLSKNIATKGDVAHYECKHHGKMRLFITNTFSFCPNVDRIRLLQVCRNVYMWETNVIIELEISLKVMNTPSWCPTIYICMRNSRGHNSFKNNSSTTCQQYAQLGLVSIILVKFF